jgi:L-alanine-DL-glutamate epimerase-like enolase superfamily enzyme
VSLPLDRTLQIGGLTFAAREYAIVRVDTADGRSSQVYALSRGLPVTSFIERNLAALLLNRDAELVTRIWRDCFAATITSGRVGIAMRAISLIDIALWDLKAQRAGLPLWQLLGGFGAEVPSTLIIGYPDGEPTDEILERLEASLSEGWQTLKIARANDLTAMQRLVEAAGAKMTAGQSLVVDAAWSWRRADEAASEVATWGTAPIAWLEDPLPPERLQAYRRLRHRAVPPVGVGDEVTDAELLRRHVEEGTADVLRLDATVCGGISVASHLAAEAIARGLRVSFHVYPELHAHLAAALGADASVERFHPAMADPADRLIARSSTFAPGAMLMSSQPGLGFEVDDDLIAGHRVT